MVLERKVCAKNGKIDDVSKEAVIKMSKTKA